jgi:hypothetical protein
MGYLWQGFRAIIGLILGVAPPTAPGECRGAKLGVNVSWLPNNLN